jgi:hypothetical protein
MVCSTGAIDTGNRKQSWNRLRLLEREGQPAVAVRRQIKKL